MTYKDSREIEAKLLEHRTWNTLELKIDSAAGLISQQLLSAIRMFQGKYLEVSSFASALGKASEQNDEILAEGLVRLGLFCSNETPNRFKALFSAFLLQEGFAIPVNDKMRWSGSNRLLARTITVESLTKIILSGAGDNETRLHFAKWVNFKNGFESMGEICACKGSLDNFIYSLALRLAQGADTNRRGHTATDIIKERLAEYGFSADLGNTNYSDVAISTLVENYDGPRKLDTIVWSAQRNLSLICQSQMYSSDVGSIQGKTVEEDYDAISKLKVKWNSLVSLTNTEGFGCHTTMLSRLRHVLNSRIDGFIQLKTLDIKLRKILKLVGCVSQLDFEIYLLDQPSFSATQSEILSASSLVHYYNDKELISGLKLYEKSGLILVNQGIYSLQKHRLPKICYYKFLDELCQSALLLDEIQGDVVCLGGLQNESGIKFSQFEELKKHYLKRYLLDKHSQEEFIKLLEQSTCLIHKTLDTKIYNNV